MIKRLAFILSITLISLAGCEKDSGIGLEIYLLDDYNTPTTSDEIITGSEKLAKNPIINYHDIIYYDSTEYYFKIGTGKAEEMNKINWVTQGTAFALTINKSIIYTGYFMPGYSSSGIRWFTMDPFSTDGRIFIGLGYPVDYTPLRSIDPRNDKRIIDLLISDNKLNH